MPIAAPSLIRHLSSAAACLAALGLGMASLPVQAKQKCTDFTAYADGDSLPQKLKQDGYLFRFGGPSSIFFGGAQFWSSGASFTTPKPGQWVEVDIFAGAGFDIELTALNANGGIEATATVPTDVSLHTVRLVSSGQAIVKVSLAQGGNESTLNRVCTRY
jgi:hypothetical protein